MLSNNLKSFVLGLALVLTLGKVAQAQTPSPNQYANLYWEASLNLAQAKQDVQQFENQNIRNADQVVWRCLIQRLTAPLSKRTVCRWWTAAITVPPILAAKMISITTIVITVRRWLVLLACRLLMGWG